MPPLISCSVVTWIPKCAHFFIHTAAQPRKLNTLVECTASPLEPATPKWRRHSSRQNNMIPALSLCKTEHFQLREMSFRQIREFFRLSTATVSLCRETGGMTSNGTENASRIEFTYRAESSVLPESRIDVRPITSIVHTAPANSIQARVSSTGGTERFHFGPAHAAACRVESKAAVEA